MNGWRGRELHYLAWNKKNPTIADLGWQSCGADALLHSSSASGPVEVCQERAMVDSSEVHEPETLTSWWRMQLGALGIPG